MTAWWLLCDGLVTCSAASPADAERDANGLLTDAIVVAYGQRMDLEGALALQYDMGRPLVDSLWVMSCVSHAAVIPYEDHMIVNTLTMDSGGL